MRPLTYEVPKALIPVAGRPILEHQIELLRRSEIRELVVCIGHLGEKIKEYFGDGKNFGVKITYSEERKVLETGGAIKRAALFLKNEPFILIHGDILVEIDLHELINFHRDQKVTATMSLTPLAHPESWGTVNLRGNRILEFFVNKKRGGTSLVNAGIYVLEPEIFNFFPKNTTFKLEAVLAKLAGKDALAGFVFEGKWFDVSTPANYSRAIKKWQK